MTSTHDVVSENESMQWRVPFFNPGSNTARQSWLRVVNTSGIDTAVTIEGLDDNGAPGDGVVSFDLAADAARMLSAQELEEGSANSKFDGQLGDGHNKWQLFVSADHPIHVMSLLVSESGHLTNLSTNGPKPWPLDATPGATVTGDDNDNRLNGGAGNDRLYGLAGDDFLAGHGGSDVLDGGPGDDWITYLESNAGVSINLATGECSGGHAEGDTIVNIESVAGSPYNDTLIGDGGSNRFCGGPGNDTFDGGAGDDTFFPECEEYSGPSGNDTFTGGPGSDVFIFDNGSQAGHYVISDFTVGEDILQLSDWGPRSVSELAVTSLTGGVIIALVQEHCYCTTPECGPSDYTCTGESLLTTIILQGINIVDLETADIRFN